MDGEYEDFVEEEQDLLGVLMIVDTIKSVPHII
jgi:hypothetical protein